MKRTALLVIEWEWLILLAISPLLFFPGGWRGLILIVIPILWLVRKVAFGYFIPHSAYDTALLVLAVALLISLTAVFDMELSFPKIAGLILGFAYFYGGIHYVQQDKSRIFHLPGLIFLLGTAMVIVGVLGSLRSPYYFMLAPLSSLIPASANPFLNYFDLAVNPNELAGILSWIIPLLVAFVVGFWGLLWGSQRWWSKPLILLLTLSLIINLFILTATQSRGGLLAVLASFFIMLAVRYQWGRWLLFFAIVVAAVAGLYFGLGPLMQGAPSTAADLGLEGRLEIWSRALLGLADFPITGMGMNGFRHIVHILYPLFIIDPGFDIGHAHNHILQAGLDLGLLGMISYLSIWILSFVLIWYSWRQTNSHTFQVYLLGLSGSLTAGWIFGTVDTIALGARPGFLWWLLLAFLFSVFEQVHSSIKVDPPLIQKTV